MWGRYEQSKKLVPGNPAFGPNHCFSKSPKRTQLTPAQTVDDIGKLTYKDEVHEGQHDAIVDAEVFERVARSLKRNGRTGSARASTKFDGLLRGILRCARCDRAMLHTSTGSGPKRYRYYVCSKADKQGYASCKSPSIPAGQIEDFVVNELRVIAGDNDLIRDIYDRTHEESWQKINEQKKEIESLRSFIRTDQAELNSHIANKASIDLIAAAQSRIDTSQQRFDSLQESIKKHSFETIGHQDIRESLQIFDDMWDTMPSKERCRLIELLVQTVNYDGAAGTIDTTFHMTGIQTLGQDPQSWKQHNEHRSFRPPNVPRRQSRSGCPAHPPRRRPTTGHCQQTAATDAHHGPRHPLPPRSCERSIDTENMASTCEWSLMADPSQPRPNSLSTSVTRPSLHKTFKIAI